MKPLHLLQSWGKVLRGKTPLLSIEITRECPLRCPGCYAYAVNRKPGWCEAAQLRQFFLDFRGNGSGEREFSAWLNGTIRSMSRWVGGEPLIRHRELSRVRLPIFSARGTDNAHHGCHQRRHPHSQAIGRLSVITVAVSVGRCDSAPDHDVRRTPATYDRNPSQYRRPPRQYPLHHRPPAPAATGLPGAISRVLERAPERSTGSGSAQVPAARESSAENAAAGRSVRPFPADSLPAIT